MNVKLLPTLLALLFVAGLGCASIDGASEPTTSPSAAATPSAGSSGGEIGSLDAARERIRQLEEQVRANERTHQELVDVARRATDAARRRAEAERANARPSAPAPAPTPQAPAQVAPPAAPIAPPASPMPNFGMMPGGGLGVAAQVPVMVPRNGVVGDVGWIDVVPPARAVGGYAPTLAVTRINPRYATEFIILGRRVCPTQDGRGFTQIVAENGQQVCVLPPNQGSPTVTFEVYREGLYTVLMRVWSVSSYTGMGTLVGERVTELHTRTYPSTTAMDGEFR